MKFLFALLAICVSASLASDVLTLTNDNFAQALADNSVLMVKFYAPWCGHCKSLAPVWEEIATDLKEKNIAIAKVDVTVEEELGKLYQIQGFPTLKLFKNGQFAADYRGPRSAEALSDFLIKKSGKPYTVVSYEQAQEILAAEANGVVIGYFSDFDDDDFDDFEAAADKETTIKYLVVADASSASSCELSNEGSIAVLSKDGSKHIFDGEIEDLAAFVSQYAYPQSMNLDPELFQSMLKDNIIIVNAFDFDAEGADKHRDMSVEVVKGHNVKQMFADSNQWGTALVRMGVVSGDVYPTFVAFDGRSEKSGPIAWDEAVTVTKEGFAAWVAGVVSGTQGTWKKSEAIPEENNAPLTLVVAKQFEEIVLDNTKDVLVMFYAPWCGHCKNLQPIYESVAEHFQNDDKVVIAKMDATANYVDPVYGIQGFPTLKFFPSGSNDVLEYQGDRTVEDFVEYVNSNRNTQV